MHCTWRDWTRAFGIGVLALLELSSARGAENIRSASSEYVIRVWDASEADLPQYSFTSIAASPDGYLWLGSFNNLSRFDGYHFTVFDPDNTPGFPDTTVTKVLVDRQGILWVGTASGVARREHARWRFYVPGHGWPGGMARSLAQDRDGAIWANADKLVVRLVGDGFVPVPITNLPADTTSVVCASDAEGNIWAMAESLLARYTNRNWVQFQLPGPGPLLGIGAARGGGMWIAQASNLHKIKLDRWVQHIERPRSYRGNAAAILEDSRGNLWVGDYNRGVVIHKPDGERLKCTAAEGLGNNSTLSLFEDSLGQIWIGSNGGGLARLRPRTFQTYDDQAGLPQVVVNSIAETVPGEFLVATHGGGLVPFRNGRFGPPIRTKADPAIPSVHLGENSWVLSLLKDPDGTVWAGTYGAGVFRIRGSVVDTIPSEGFPDLVASTLYLDRSKRLWISTSSALIVKDGDRYTRYTTNHGLTTYPVRAICEDSSKQLWVCDATTSPLRLKAGKFIPYTVPGAAPLRASALYADKAGAFWIGCYSRQLLRIKSDKVTVYSLREGLPVENIEAVIEDNLGNLWLASDQGVARITKASLEGVASGSSSRLDCLLFDRGDGLRTTLCRDNFAPNCLSSADGRLWFATMKGLSVVDPARVNVRVQPPPTWVEEVVADGRPLSLPGKPEKPVLVPAGTKRLLITYTGIDLASPEAVRFQHRLDGLDRAWVEAGTERSSQLQDLRPGTYTFHVRARTKEGVWSTQAAAVAFQVVPFYWQTAWFRVLSILVAGSGTALCGWQVQSRRSRRKWERGEQLRTLEAERAYSQELARAKEAVQDALQRFEAVIQNTPLVAIQGFDQNGLIQHWNGASETLYGFSAAEAIGKRIQDLLIPPEEVKDFEAELESTWRTGKPTEAREWPVQTKARRRCWVYSSMFAVSEEGKTIEVFSMDVDVTERKRLETQLQQARKMEAVGQLAGGVAHDFNNILTVIQGHVALLLLNPNTPPEQVNALKEVDHASQRAAGLTRQLLAFSRRQVLQMKPLDLNDVLGNVATMLQRVLGEHITLEFSYSPAHLWVRADALMVEQIVVNLAVNARDAMPSGGTLAISTEAVHIDPAYAFNNPDARPGVFAALTVTDTGAGMDTTTLSHLFEPFFTTKEVGKGTGLGLATVYGIVQQHQGWIEVKSVPEKGSTFRVFFPACAPAKKAETTLLPRAGVAPVPGGKEIILVVEDDPLVRNLTHATLSRYGYEVLEAGNGREALQIWDREAGRIDLLLTDMVMPGGLSGRQLAARLRETKPTLKVIYMSGYSFEMVRGDLPPSEANNYLAKPFDSVRLVRMIRACLDTA